MSNNKQSSVEWLFDELARINFEYATNKITPRDFQEQKEKIKQQAKAMHKEEHGQTWDKSIENFEERGRNEMRAWVDFDEYYNETFGE